MGLKPVTSAMRLPVVRIISQRRARSIGSGALGRPHLRSVARHASTNRNTEATTGDACRFAPNIDISDLVGAVSHAAMRLQLVHDLRDEFLDPSTLKFVG